MAGWLTTHDGAHVPKVGRQFSGPAPACGISAGSVGVLGGKPHALPDLALDRPGAAALVARRLVDVGAYDKGVAAHAPLRHGLLDPPDGLDGPAAAGALRLRPRAVSGARRGELGHLLHAGVGREGGHVRPEPGLVAGSVVVPVLRQLAPHASEDEVAQSRHPGVRRGLPRRPGRRRRRCRLKRRHDKLRRLHLGDVLQEQVPPRRGHLRHGTGPERRHGWRLIPSHGILQTSRRRGSVQNKPTP